MVLKSVFFLILCSVVSLTELASQESSINLHFNHLTSNDGLSSNRVNCIFEDQDGFIWFGTEDGLNLYNGISFSVFKADDADTASLLDNAVYSIAGDPNNENLWVGTKDGICYFNKETYTFQRVLTSDQNNGFSIHNVYGLTFDFSGNLWASTTYGLYWYNPVENKAIRYIHDAENKNTIRSSNVNQVYVLDKDQLLICTRKGLDLFTLSTGRFQPLFNNMEPIHVNMVYKDSHDEFWVCTDSKGLFRMQLGEKPVLFRHNFKSDLLKASDRINAIIEDDNSNLFISARDKGLLFYNRLKEELTFFEPDRHDLNGLNSKAIISAFKSSSGILWFGTYSKGVNYIDINRKKFEHYNVNYKTDGLLSNNIRSFFEDAEGNIWIGTKEGGGLSKFNPKTGTFKNYSVNNQKQSSISSDYILCISELNNHILMLGTLKQGIDLFDKRTETFRNISIPSAEEDIIDNNIYALFKDLSDSIWVATLGYLYNYNAHTNSFTKVKNIRSVKCISQNSRTGEIWLGTKFDGLYKLRGGEVKAFASGDSLLSSLLIDITTLRFDSDSSLWIGTSNGLHLLNLHTQAIASWYEDDGLPSNRISAIEREHSGRIWVSTSNGLSRFDKRQGIFKNYYISDGLQGNEFEKYLSLKASDGAMYFGGSYGFNRFYPSEIHDNLNVPKIQFTDFKIANQSVEILDNNAILSKHINKTDYIKLTYDKSDFTFEFVALNYTSPEKNTYRYKLEGYDDNWIYSGNSRVATYTNIEAGEYVFKVTGSNNDEYWNENNREIRIKILPPPWKSIWAYIIYIILIGLVAYAFYSTIVRRIQQQNQILLERQEREKLEQINQMKLRFFTNISHEFRTPLTLISSPLSKLIRDDGLREQERKYLHQTMNRNVKRLLRLIKQLMEFRKLENKQLKIRVKEGNLSQFVHEIINGFREFASNKEIDIVYTTTIANDQVCWFDHGTLDGVIFNLLSNAMKFSKSDSEIHVSVSMPENDVAEIAVRDFGRGIEKDKLEKIFDRFYSDDQGLEEFSGTGIGLAFSKNMVMQHHGNLTVTSEVNKGSVFTIRIPVSKLAYNEDEIIEGNATSEWVSTEEYPSLDEEYKEEISDDSGKLKLLIAEDNIELRKFLKMQLTKFRIIEVGDGEAAYEKSKELLPDIIISDVMMPKMDGIEFCRTLKQDHRTSHIPIILLTAKSALEYKIEGIEKGADAYLEKPFDINLLEAQINNLLSQREILRERFKSHSNLSLIELTTNNCDEKFFKEAEDIVSSHLSDEYFSVDDLAEKLNLSRSQLFRKFKNVTGYNPSEYIRIKRIDLAKDLLKEGNLNVTEVSELTGFRTSSYFISIFKKHTGLTPKEYLKG